MYRVLPGPVHGAGPGLPRILILGDSLTKFLRRDLNYPGAHEVVSCPGATISSLKRTFQQMKTLSPAPDKIFLHVGTNSITTVVQQRALLDMRSLVLSVQERYPVADIVVNKILPRYDWKDYDDCRYYFNFELHKFIGNSARVASAGSDISSRDYSPDGLHLSRSGYLQFADDFNKAIGHRPAQGRYPASMIPPLMLRKLKKKKPQQSQQPMQHKPSTQCQPEHPPNIPSVYVKHRCEPTSTAKEDQDGFVLVTNTSKFPIVIPNHHHMYIPVPLMAQKPFPCLQTLLPKADTPYVASRKKAKRQKAARRRIPKGRARKSANR